MLIVGEIISELKNWIQRKFLQIILNNFVVRPTTYLFIFLITLYIPYQHHKYYNTNSKRNHHHFNEILIKFNKNYCLIVCKWCRSLRQETHFTLQNLSISYGLDYNNFKKFSIRFKLNLKGGRDIMNS